MSLEEMSSFFTKRVEDYDNHMINEVEGCRDGYEKIAEFVPSTTNNLLDLGCGTGLQLEKIFNKLPNLKVTGIDITKAMLDKLKEKYETKDLYLINASYFDYDFGIEVYDTAISFQTLHHFSHKDKRTLFEKIYTTLKTNGFYIEGDYMVQSQEEEDFYYAENKRLREEMGVMDGFFHYDTPCTIENEINLLKSVGFSQVKKLWQKDNTVILVAKK
ncbi:class I SAM-dependent methyltransferase [Clostridium cellulovorans]|uniref:Methyltransferase type 11 n=1 Tax=Clostridium cellulovorans (strain ATCC 35296 / DSM 3052 / OCM 3 / 743B) TaxID=573061 RepID=D9SQW5_CLOC7|nr:class I SAM-dependent methyltransferase [Clostridium cellulovorans]ADL50253.1 Methyltransferase type 11 [Clostridium cellulovorans 743B]